MGGVDPKDYYKAHPIENKVEMRSESHMLHFPAGSARLTEDSVVALAAGLKSFSPDAVETVQVQMKKSSMRTQRQQQIARLLTRMGYDKHAILFEPSDTLARDEARLDVSYAAVVGPRCPDWRTSSVTTYSNTQQGGWSCATKTNLGLMVADPRDLERGRANVHPDADRNSAVLMQYHKNETIGGDATSSSASTSGQ